MTGPTSLGQPRIAPVTDPTDDERELLRLVTGDGGPAPNLFRTLVRNPTLMKRTNLLAGALLARGTLPARDREIVILRVAALTACAYESQHHAALAVQAGLSDDEIQQATSVSNSFDMGSHLDLLIAFTDGLVQEHEAPAAAWEALASTYDDEQMIELVLLVGFYAMLAGFLNTVRTPLDAQAVSVDLSDENWREATPGGAMVDDQQ